MKKPKPLSLTPSDQMAGMQPHTFINNGFFLRSILFHSLWLTTLGLVLFRFATANTQTILYVNIFAISGVILATGPWLIQLLVSVTTMFLYKAGIHDLTWVVKSSSKEDLSCQGSGAGHNDIEGGAVSGKDSFIGTEMVLNQHGVNKVENSLSNGKNNGPRLQRNRTV